MQSSPWIGIVLAIVVAAGIAGWAWWRNHRPGAADAQAPAPLPDEWDIEARPVFSADERRMHRQLRDALPHHVILAKLPLVRFCQPSDPERVRYWYDLLGSIHVHFAICSANGRVLAAIDLHDDKGGPPSRATRIKQSVLGACRVRYLRCPADHLPSIPELQLLVPQASPGSHRGPQPAHSVGAGALVGAEGGPRAPWAPATGTVRRRERASTLWQDSLQFTDSFFLHERRFEAPAPGDHDGLEPLPATMEAVEPHPTDPGHAAPRPSLAGAGGARPSADA